MPYLKPDFKMSNTDYDVYGTIGSLNTDGIFDNTEGLLMISLFRCYNDSMVVLKKKGSLSFRDTY